MNLPWNKTEKLVQELAWRDYWQQVWVAKKELIFSDLKQKQLDVDDYLISKAVVKAKTGIRSIDHAIGELYKTGYMHNHMRMYLASISCNIARSHWSMPSRWMYAHLLDGDLASNSLSWQWVAGTFSSKKYYANQENINKFFHDDQKNTFLDIEYEEFGTMEVPEELLKKIEFKPETAFPESISLGEIKPSTNTLIYNYYNLDPDWHKNEDVQRILLLEPSLFKKYPVNKKCMDFAVSLSGNIHGIKIYVGEFDTILNHIGQQHLVYKEHPANNHYKGTIESRDWMFKVNGYYPSFFKYWKACQKSIQE